jgi:hypothetical protein
MKNAEDAFLSRLSEDFCPVTVPPRLGTHWAVDRFEQHNLTHLPSDMFSSLTFFASSALSCQQ